MSGTDRRGVIAGVLVKHGIFTPRGYAAECCFCGWEADLEQLPEGQGERHQAEMVDQALGQERDAARAEVAALRARVEAVAVNFDTVVGFRGAVTAVRAALAEAAPDQASERSGFPQTVRLVGDHRPVWEKQRDGDSERSGE